MNVPSKTITYEDMSNYGYTWPGMLPLTKEEAIDIFQNKGLSVYRLFEDGTETAIEAIEDFDKFDADIDMFGVEEKDWIRYIETLDIENER